MKKIYEMPLLDQLNLAAAEMISNTSSGNEFPQDNEVCDLDMDI